MYPVEMQSFIWARESNVISTLSVLRGRLREKSHKTGGAGISGLFDEGGISSFAMRSLP